MLFGKYINKYYLKYLAFFLIGIAALVAVDYVQTYIPKFLGQIIDEDNQLIANMDELWKIIGGILICAAIMFAGRIIWRLTIFRASGGISAGLRHQMFTKAEQLPTGYYHENKVGNIMNWFTNDVDEIHEFFGWGTIMMVDALFLSVIVIISMIRLDPWMTLIAAVPILLIIVWGALVEKFMALRWENRQAEFDKLYDFAQENFTGIRVIKAFVKQNQEIHAFAKIARKNKDVNVGFARLSVIFDVIIELILIFEVAFVLGFGGWFVYAAATSTPITIFGHEINLTIGQLIQFVGYIDLIVWPMIALGQVVTMRSRAKGSLRRISAFLDTPVVVQSPKDAIVLKDVKGEIRFSDFSFTYPSSKISSLDNVSLTIKPGETIGIVGKIGSGKTTLVNSLLRLYNVEEGTIFVDGVDIMKCDIASLRDQIAYAPQDNFLFSDKIENNIAFSSDQVDNDKVIESAKFADVHDNVVEFPNGYETVSGERGVTLSGGQKQRISIARAHYKNAPILILDDSVSAVDLKTEETILHNIATERKGKTTIVVASRVSTVMHMDRVLVMDQGKVAAFGSHEELMKTSELYQRMVYLQKLESEVEGGGRHE